MKSEKTMSMFEIRRIEKVTVTMSFFGGEVFSGNAKMKIKQQP